MKIGLVIVPTPGWWRERLVGTSTNAGRKVLKVKLFFTFSELCIVIHIREKDQQDAHFFSLIYSN